MLHSAPATAIFKKLDEYDAWLAAYRYKNRSNDENVPSVAEGRDFPETLANASIQRPDVEVRIVKSRLSSSVRKARSAELVRLARRELSSKRKNERPIDETFGLIESQSLFECASEDATPVSRNLDKASDLSRTDDLINRASVYEVSKKNSRTEAVPSSKAVKIGEVTGLVLALLTLIK